MEIPVNMRGYVSLAGISEFHKQGDGRGLFYGDFSGAYKVDFGGHHGGDEGRAGRARISCA